MTALIEISTQQDWLDGLSDREDSLLRAGYAVASQQGSHRMSLQDVADVAGVSKGLVLYHFKSKENLLLATMRRAMLRSAQRIREHLGDPHQADDLIGGLMEAVWVAPEPNRDFYLLYLDLIEHVARVPSFGELPRMTETIINGLYAEVLCEARSRGILVVPDLDRAAADVRALVDGQFLAWLQNEDWVGTHAAYRERCRAGVMSLLS